MREPTILLVICFLSFLPISESVGQGNPAKEERFITVSNSVPERPWHIPIWDDAVWVITADPFLLSAARIYLRYTLDAMLLLGPLLKDLRTDLVKNQPKGELAKPVADAIKSIDKALDLSLELDGLDIPECGED